MVADEGPDIRTDASMLLRRLGIAVKQIFGVFPDHILFTEGFGDKSRPKIAWLFRRDGYTQPVIRLEDGWPAHRGVLFPHEEP